MSVTIGNTILKARLVDGKYPNYNAVIPQTCKSKLVADVSYLSEIVSRLLTVANPASKLIKIEAGTDKTTFSSQDIDLFTSAKEKTDLTATQAITIGLKGTFLLELISCLSGNICMKFIEPGKAIIITPEEQEEDREITLLIMPLMLND